MRVKYKLENYKFSLIILLLLICILGALLVNSARSSLFTMEIIGITAGFFIMIGISLIDYSFVLLFYRILYLINLALLIAVKVVGHSTGGAQRWLRIGGFQFQPSELCKIILILFFAQYIMEHEDDLNSWKTILKSVILFAIPAGLVFIQPDLSTTITIVAVIFVMMFVAGLSYKVIIGTIVLVGGMVSGLLFLGERYGQLFLTENQYGRIMAWLHPENYPNTMYQQNNSLIAIGSGQLFGKGLNNNVVDSVKNGNYISEPQTDFIFAIAGEELGFAGCIAIILLLLLITLTCIFIARRARDMAGRMICVGMATWISVQSFVNICVATGLLPNTGIPLPFVSYGLTSLLSLLIGMGLVLNVGLQQK